MKRAFGLYEWLGPLLLTPLAIWLWWRAGGGRADLAALAVAVPVVHGYVVPAVGTNVLKVWGFTTRVRIGAFRPQHGFVFGSATAALVALLFWALGPGAGLGLRAGATGALLLAINWAYDALAIRHGVLVVRNQCWADGQSPWAVAGDYVVWFFGLFGLIYGALLHLALERMAGNPAPWIAAGVAATMLVPTLAYVAASHLRHGHSGCRPVERSVGA